MKRHAANGEKSDIEPEQNAQRLPDLPPGDLFGKEQLPDICLKPGGVVASMNCALLLDRYLAEKTIPIPVHSRTPPFIT